MYLRALEICVLKYTNLILQNFFQLQALAWQAALKKAKVKLDLLADIDMLFNGRKRYKRRNMSFYL